MLGIASFAAEQSLAKECVGAMAMRLQQEVVNEEQPA